MSAVDPHAPSRRTDGGFGQIAIHSPLWASHLAAGARELWGERERVLDSLPFALVALAGMGLIWTHVLALEQGFWGDELVSVIAYIHRGPSGIFGNYVPNDHMLFELLTWASTGLLGEHGQAATRFWSVAPTLGAVGLMTWWLWRRLDPWVAAIFAVLASASPMILDLGTEARGYGLGFLSGAMMVIAADRFAATRTRRAVSSFAGGALVGIWTLPVIVLPFIGAAGVLLLRRALRRSVLIAVLVVGLASLLFYLPVLGDLIKSSRQHDGLLLAWHSVLLGPARDLLAPNVSLLLPRASAGVDEAIATVVLAAGAVALWRRPERMLVLLLLFPAFFTYLGLKLGGFYVVDAFNGHASLSTFDITNRFTSFLLLPLLALCAAGLVTGGRSLARVRVHHARLPAIQPLGALVVAGVLVVSLIALADIDHLAHDNAKVPEENYREVAEVVRDSRVVTVLVDTPQSNATGFEYYLNRKITTLSPSQLAPLFCTKPAPFVYIEHLLHNPEPADTTCLKQRGAVSIHMPQRRTVPTVVWIIRGQRDTARSS